MTATPTVTTYVVRGMTCGHCVAAVTAELTAIDGVRSVAVNLVAGGDSPVEVTSDHMLDLDRIREAVDEAGYALADAAPAGA